MSKRRLNAEELNSRPRPEFPERGTPSGPRHVGEVWALRPEICEWRMPGEPVPALFPVVCLGSAGEIEGIPLVSIAPMHQLRENAGSEDLFCGEGDGPFADLMIAAWARRTILEAHLGRYGGTLGAATTARLEELRGGEGGADLRLHTGTAIRHGIDGRVSYRRDFLRVADMLSRPVEELVAVLEKAAAVGERVGAAMDRESAESLIREAARTVWKERFVETAGTWRLEVMTEETLDNGIAAVYELYGRDDPRGLTALVGNLVAYFRREPSPGVLCRLDRELDAWNARL